MFTKPEPRILIDLEARILIFEALDWGRAEQRPEGADLHPIHELWARHKGSVSALIVGESGFTRSQLEATCELLEAIITDPLYTERPTAECKGALAVVEHAMGILEKFGESLE